jgi:hypothetical protein
MHALEEKNALTQELEKTRKVAEDLQGKKYCNCVFINECISICISGC